MNELLLSIGICAGALSSSTNRYELAKLVRTGNLHIEYLEFLREQLDRVINEAKKTK